MNKTKKLTIRLSEAQLKKLTDTLIDEQITKSQIIREIIDKYVRTCRRTSKEDVVQVIKEIKDAGNKI
jgi:hypothetical protein